ncbi:hypothetical protein [Halapricum hydrolyticum]|uniref:Uncharacterized protein n=1 Tax=Halapricum hydrolyticum TaxID=2979991 RepID=A0AAE3IE90_9EURY|nr:hypothetical protein [Halapricum hydrolyticum]MCU4719369.1 hypothetical protein [Halapricum hydrolyticum]MCU4728366.1 hypothetical protein [Halapricum hydrolyticum]
MSYRRTSSPFLTGVLVGVGVWIAGYLFALVLVAVVQPPATEHFAVPGYAGAIYVFGAVLALLSLSGESPPLLLLSPAFVVLLVAVAGGAIVPVRADRLDSGWVAAKAGATVGIGVCLATLAALALYLLPSTPVSNTPVSLRYVALLFGNLLLPALAGALGGALQHAVAMRQS